MSTASSRSSRSFATNSARVSSGSTNLVNTAIVSVISIGLIIAVTWAALFLLSPALQQYHDNASAKRRSEATQRHGLTLSQAKSLFDRDSDADRRDEHRYVATVQTDAYDGLSLDGPLVPLDCEKNVRICLTDADCAILCKRKSGIQEMTCDSTDMVCRLTVKDLTDQDTELPPDQPEPNCKTDKGEYALLQGYNELGIAQWNCVQLYPGWMDQKRSFCEGGVMNIDTRKRAPSYLDCTCPENKVRMVYGKSQLGQEVFGLPHCVFNDVKHLYQADYLFM